MNDRPSPGVHINNALIQEFAASLEPETLIRAHTSAAIARCRTRAQARGPRRAGSDAALRLLLVGYSGAGNVGADVRTGEIIRQLLGIFGEDRLRLGLATREALSHGAFAAVECENSGAYFPAFLEEVVERYDGVIVSEGCVLKSNFSNTLATMLAGALGMAAAEDKLSVAYGAEAGEMEPEIASFFLTHCRESLFIARSHRSYEIIRDQLGLRTVLGADPAWTFQPSAPEKGEALLREAGWDGQTPVVAICPVNPFWWPVRPDVLKAALMQATGEFRDTHYQSVYFHEDSDEAQEKYRRYLKEVAGAVKAFSAEASAFPVLVEMEPIDHQACVDLQSEMGKRLPAFTGAQCSMYDLVSILRQASIVVSSRYHALVTSMPAGVVGIGVSMDERINNLFAERGISQYVVDVADPNLGDALLALLRNGRDHGEELRAGTAPFVAGQLHRVGEMGKAICTEICRRFPDFEPPKDKTDVLDFLPTLPTSLSSLLPAA
ncbi:MAG TPA: polysaccharide pyruvyl transferase family protein [Pyrinomonadaceae bacterium]|nr:polysaccharide pyruvyl transferase family protein [Pyrinomonadaceae bacterium]